MFSELMPLLATRTLLITVAKMDDNTLRVNVIPTQVTANENPALTIRLTNTGMSEELDAELGKHLGEYVQTNQQTAVISAIPALSIVDDRDSLVTVVDRV